MKTNQKIENDTSKNEPTFIEFLNEARRRFVQKVNEQKWNTDLRCEAENLLIAYDQAVSYIDKVEAEICIKPDQKLKIEVSTSDTETVQVQATITELLPNNRAMVKFKRPFTGFLGKKIVQLKGRFELTPEEIQQFNKSWSKI